MQLTVSTIDLECINYFSKAAIDIRAQILNQNRPNLSFILSRQGLISITPQWMFKFVNLT